MLLVWCLDRPQVFLCSALICFHGLVPNFEIQVQYLQTAQGKFSIMYVSSGSNNLEEMVMVLTCFTASLKNDCAFFIKDLLYTAVLTEVYR